MKKQDNSNKSKLNSIAPRNSTKKVIAGVSAVTIMELAALGVAGYFLWRNRSKIQDILEDNGVDLTHLKDNAGSWIQKGLSFIKDQMAGSPDKTLHS